MGLFVAVVRPPSDLPLKRTINIRVSGFDQTGAHDAIAFCVGLSFHRELPNGLRPTACMQRTTTCASANYQSCFLSHGGSGRAKTQACPARRPILLASAYLVRVAGTPVELGGVP